MDKMLWWNHHKWKWSWIRWVLRQQTWRNKVKLRCLVLLRGNITAFILPLVYSLFLVAPKLQNLMRKRPIICYEVNSLNFSFWSSNSGQTEKWPLSLFIEKFQIYLFSYIILTSSCLNVGSKYCQGPKCLNFRELVRQYFNFTAINVPMF